MKTRRLFSYSRQWDEEYGRGRRPLCMRSKITVKWTTCPADLGYDGKTTSWLTDKGKVMGMTRAFNFPQELARKIGQGTYRAIVYFHHGRQIGHNDIENVILAARWAKENR